MAKRGRGNRHATGADSIKIQAKPGRSVRQAYTSPQESATGRYAAPVKRAGKNYAHVSMRGEPSGYQLVQEDLLPTIMEPEQNALARMDLDPMYEAISEMRALILEAEQNMQRSQQARQVLETEMEAATQLAEEAENDLAAAAKKAAYLKHEAEQVCSEGLPLRQQLSEEEDYWKTQLQEKQFLLQDTEQKLRIAEEEAQRVNYAKEVAARMNEREMWRLGSSKQGLWLQRRKVQGNALSMSRDKSGNWHMPKIVSSPGATFAQTMLEREQKLQKNYNDKSGERLDMLSESAKALAERQYDQLEEDFLEQLASREAAQHLADATESLAGSQAEEATPDPTPPSTPIPTEVNSSGQHMRSIMERRLVATPIDITDKEDEDEPVSSQVTVADSSPAVEPPQQQAAAQLTVAIPEAPATEPSVPETLADTITALESPVLENPVPESSALSEETRSALHSLVNQPQPQAAVAEDQPAPLDQAEQQPVATPLTLVEEQPAERATEAPVTPGFNVDILRALHSVEGLAEPKPALAQQPSAAMPEMEPAQLTQIEQPSVAIPLTLLKEEPVAPQPAEESVAFSLNGDILQALRSLESVPLQQHNLTPEAELEDMPAEQDSFTPQAEQEALIAAQQLPEGADPLQFLAMRAATYAASGQTATAAAPQLVAEEQVPLQAEPVPQGEVAQIIPIRDEDMQRLSQQANMLAQQHLTRQQPQTASMEQPSGRAQIAQKVAEETGHQDHLLKEQQTAELAIAAAMAAARKAAQSAMAISEQVNQQMPAMDNRRLADDDRPYSVERIIADALSKAAVADQHRR